MHWRDWVDRFGPVLATHRMALSCLLPRVATTSLRFTMVFSDHRSSSDVSKESCKLRIATNKSTTTLAHTHTLSIRSGPGAEIVHFSVDKLVTVSVPCLTTPTSVQGGRRDRAGLPDRSDSDQNDVAMSFFALRNAVPTLFAAAGRLPSTLRSAIQAGVFRPIS